MILIDGVEYELWTPPNEDDFERVVKEHAQDIFGEQSVYLDLKQKLKSRSGIGSIPDGYVIMLGDSPHWHIVEVELSSHPLHEHIVSQVSKFIIGIKNPRASAEILATIYAEINGDDFLQLKVKKASEPTEIYKFLSDLISKPPILTIIIEKDTEGLREAISTLAHTEIKVVEFKTFTREGVGLAIHAHLFEPVFQAPARPIPPVVIRPPIPPKRGRITVKDLIDANILKGDQVIYGRHKGNRYEGKILDDGKIFVMHSGKIFTSPSSAASDIKGCEENGWRWWHTKRENGEECLLDDLRKEYRSNPSP